MTAENVSLVEQMSANDHTSLFCVLSELNIFLKKILFDSYVLLLIIIWTKSTLIRDINVKN